MDSADESQTGGEAPDTTLPATTVPLPRRKLTQANYESLAIMLYNLVPVERCAEMLGVEETSIRYYAEGKSAGFNAVRDAYRDRVVRAQVHHNSRLTEMMELGYAAVQDALAYQEGTVSERRLRKDTAFQLFDRIIPTEQKGLVNVEITQQNLTVQTEVRQTHGVLSEKFGDLLRLALNQNPMQHVREGDAALPSAQNVQPVVDVEFSDSDS
jgi:hypothetical protein